MIFDSISLSGRYHNTIAVEIFVVDVYIDCFNKQVGTMQNFYVVTVLSVFHYSSLNSTC